MVTFLATMAIAISLLPSKEWNAGPNMDWLRGQISAEKDLASVHLLVGQAYGLAWVHNEKLLARSHRRFRFGACLLAAQVLASLLGSFAPALF